MKRSISKADVLALARGRYGKGAGLREDSKAVNAAGRLAAVNALPDAKAAMKAVRVQLGELKDGDSRLMKAARFALDVDGDEPSWSELRSAVEASEKRAELVAEEIRLMRRVRELEGLAARHPWTVGRSDGFFFVVEGYADTLNEMAEWIRSGRVL